MRFKTNAENLDELDIALEELSNFAIFRAEYIRQGECLAEDVELDPAISRLAMFDKIELNHTARDTRWERTKWHAVRSSRYDKRIDHSTHSLWPFVGKLEPRLARALINLTVGPFANALVVDPFCGSGTVLLEADLMGFQSLGGDIDPFAAWLAETKTLADDQEFERRVDALWSHALDVRPPLVQQRQACPPRGKATVVVESAAELLTRLREVDAIVTSPPYYDAINYNDRHAGERKRLGLPAPAESTMGVGQTLQDYALSVRKVAEAAVKCLRSGGRIALVTATYRGVDTTILYLNALIDAGLKHQLVLQRRYRSAVLDVQQDDINILAKP